MPRIADILQTLDRSESNKHRVPRYSFLCLMPVGDYVDLDGAFDIKRCYEHHIEVWLEHREWRGYSLVMLDEKPVCIGHKYLGYYNQLIWFSKEDRLRMIEFTLECTSPFGSNKEESILASDTELYLLEQQTDQPKYKRYFKEQA